MVLFKNMSKMHGLLNNFLRINVSMPEENFLFFDAIDAALRMGQPGDLVLIFADALTRSWKQVIKFRAEGSAPLLKAEATLPATVMGADEAVSEIEGLVRDERGVRR